MPNRARGGVVQVAVPAPLRRVFDYRCAAPTPRPGARVRVPFGRGGRECIGVVVSAEPAEAGRRLKRVGEVLDDGNLFGDRLLELILWAAKYYHHPLGEALHTALPAALRKGKPLADPDGAWFARALPAGDAESAESAAAQLNRAPAQRRLYEELRGRWVEVAALGERRDALRRLREKNLAEVAWRPAPADDTDAETVAGGSTVALNAEQQAAVDAIVGGDGRARLTERGRGGGDGGRGNGCGGDGDETGVAETRFASFLLHGVTGSGKTEVYLEAARRVIEAGRQALILVPEIALTPQLVARVRARLGNAGGGVGVLHSGLPDEQRYRAWWRAREGRVGAVLGTRSAIFTPLKSPGLIIVDEEHDLSYKQQDGFRYHARDLAIKRADLEGVPVALGSATPSMETRHNAGDRHRRHRRLTLQSRGGDAQLPRVAFIDIKRHRPADGVSAPLLSAIDERLKRGEQSIIFLNRRGFAPTVQCAECGWQAVCGRCDARLTFHRSPPHRHPRSPPHRHPRSPPHRHPRSPPHRHPRNLLSGGGDDGGARDGGDGDGGKFRCHHCGRVEPARDECAECNARLLLLGAGTQRIERRLREKFPDARIARLDRDRMTRQAQLESALRAITEGATDIIIGTQLIAKGHDFARVTLVGVVNADQGLYSADFRAPEYLFQQLTQVSGRAGRGAAAGEVLVQTAHPNHPTLQTMRRHDFERFARLLLAERRLADCPPFCHLALWRAESTAAGAAVEFLGDVAATGRHLARGRFDAVQIMDAVVSPMEKRAGRYRAQLLVKSATRGPLHRLLDEWLAAVENDPKSRRARWSIDVDPMEMF